jgi:hypothetical protein
MTEKLETVLDKASSIANPVNSLLLQEFYQYMMDNRKSDSYKKNLISIFFLSGNGPIKCLVSASR